MELSNLNSSSYPVSINLESKDDGTYVGGIGHLKPMLDDVFPLASFSVKTNGDVIYEGKTGTAGEIDSPL